MDLASRRGDVSTGAVDTLVPAVHTVSWDSWDRRASGHSAVDTPWHRVAARIGPVGVHPWVDSRWEEVMVDRRSAGMVVLERVVHQGADHRLVEPAEQLDAGVPHLPCAHSPLPSCVPSILCESP